MGFYRLYPYFDHPCQGIGIPRHRRQAVQVQALDSSGFLAIVIYLAKLSSQLDHYTLHTSITRPLPQFSSNTIIAFKDTDKPLQVSRQASSPRYLQYHYQYPNSTSATLIRYIINETLLIDRIISSIRLYSLNVQLNQYLYTDYITYSSVALLLILAISSSASEPTTNPILILTF